MGLLKCTGSSYYNNPIYADIQGMSRVFIHLVVGRLCPFRLNQGILSRLSLDIDRKNPLKMSIKKSVSIGGKHYEISFAPKFETQRASIFFNVYDFIDKKIQKSESKTKR